MDRRQPLPNSQWRHTYGLTTQDASVHPQHGNQKSGISVAQAMTSALTNPYAQQYQAAYSSHYVQAVQSSHYAQAYMSSDYSQGSSWNGQYGNHTVPNVFSTQGWSHPTPAKPTMPPPNSSSWYTPGNCRCTYENCNFIGSAKSLELHRMDRHLIYPPGWKERKRKDDWDADPSLKGKKLPVQGTNIILDTPEDIEQWIAERKKRWPSAARTEDKEQKRAEALERGQLDLADPSFGGRKRRRIDSEGAASSQGDSKRGGRGRGRGRGNGRQMGRGGGRGGIHGANETPTHRPTPTPALDLSLPAKPTFAPTTTAPTNELLSDSSSDDDDAPPEAISSKSIIIALDPTSEPAEGKDETMAEPPPTTRTDKSHQLEANQNSLVGQAKTVVPRTQQPMKKPRPPQPKPVVNPFAPKRSLLRNLLLPEIRMTVSNLSQAIRFLVDNDFLDNVELKPGDAQPKIEVLSETTVTDAPHTL